MRGKFNYLVTLAVLLPSFVLANRTISFNERFVMAEERGEALAELIPGTQDYYYYHALHALNEGRLGEAKGFIDAGVKKYHHPAPLRMLENRYHLLNYEQDGNGTLNYLRRLLGLRFDDAQKQLKPEVRFATELNQDSIAFKTLAERALRRESRHSGRFEPTAFDWLMAQSRLTTDQRRHLLGRLSRPDYPGLPAMVVADLKAKHSRGFGSHTVHRTLTIPQLEACLVEMPELLKHGKFIDTYLAKLRPSNDVAWPNPDDPTVMRDYLKRVQAFVDRLPAAQNSLRAHVLYHRLRLGWQAGQYDRDLFIAYLKLPRPVHYANPKWLDRREFVGAKVNLRASFQAVTTLPPILGDEELVRDHLMHFLETAEDYSAFDEYVADSYLKRCFAETKMLHGIGDQEQWFAMLAPTEVKSIRDRIELVLQPTNPVFVAPDGKVELAVAIKHMPELLVKVYEINAANYYRQHLAEITTAIELDGLVPNHARTLKYKQPPMRRHAESIAFPELDEPGLYVVELIGNGVSSRALIRKGRLRQLERPTSGGHAFTLYDEQQAPLPEAVIWMGGREYGPDERGEIHIPFTTKSSAQNTPIVMVNGSVASLGSFSQQAERYALKAGFHVPREALVPGQDAAVVVAPQLLLNGRASDLALLKEVSLTIRSTDLDGLAAEKMVTPFVLQQGEVSAQPFRVPERLQRLDLILSGTVRNLAGGKDEILTVSTSLRLNGIHATAEIMDVLLQPTAAGYRLEMIGRNGESLKDRPVQLSVKHRDFTDDVDLTLKSDADGLIHLGALQDIVWVKARSPEGRNYMWSLTHDRANASAWLHLREGERLRVPVMTRSTGSVAKELSLLELRGGRIVADRIEYASLRGGFAVLEGLPAGDYRLTFKQESRQVMLRVAAGESLAGYIVGKARVLTEGDAASLQIDQLTIEKDQLVVHVANASAGTRVHVAASRYQLGQALFPTLARPVFPRPRAFTTPAPESQYVSGRLIGDEYRYIMERRNGHVYPGNMLTRPSLLLNPWSPRETVAGKEALVMRGIYGSRSPGSRGSALGQHGGSSMAGGGEGADAFSSVDFLPGAANATVGLKTDRKGFLRIPLAELPAGQSIEVVAVNASSSVSRRLLRPQSEVAYRDLRLSRYLDPAGHFTEQKRVARLSKGESFTVADPLSAKVELVDSLRSVHRLMTAIRDDAVLQEFSFVLDWPELDEAKRRELYKKYACHELHLFLAKRDPDFFKAVVAPYLANKKEPTFMDDWLAERTLGCYLEPWSFERLNMAERALVGSGLPERRASLSRHLADLMDSLPLDIEGFNRRFDGVLRSSGLEGDDKVGAIMALAKKEMKEKVLGTDSTSFAVSVDDVVGLASGEGRMFKSMPAPSVDRIRQAGAKDGTMALEMIAEEMEAEDDFDRDGPFDDRRERDRKQRGSARQFYRKLEKTREWVESNYYRHDNLTSARSLVDINRYWCDLAATEPGQPFLSEAVADSTRSFTEMMLALATIDLPFEKPEHEIVYRDGAMVITAGSDMLLYHRQVMAADTNTLDRVLLISQNFFAQDDRYRYERQERFDKFVAGAFQRGRAYGCQLVMTNPTSTRRKVEMIWQIPAGAMPLQRGRQTQSSHAVLEPFSTQTREYFFYFPVAGTFEQYPVHVAQNEGVIGFADPMRFTVLDELNEVDAASWEHISQFGTLEQVVAYLETHNVERLDVGLLAWRMRDAAVFSELATLLAARHVYHPSLWKYALIHRDLPGMRRFLEKTPALVEHVGAFIESPLLSRNPIERLMLEHKEYWPLVNARTFKLGKDRKILNQAFHEQYERFLKAMTTRSSLGADERMVMVLYMLLQERTGEALALADSIARDATGMPLQHDYMTAYLAFYREQPAVARQLAKGYADYPVERWRHLFGEVLAQCDEIGGKVATVTDRDDRAQSQGQLADSEPRLELQIEDDVLQLAHANIGELTANFYPMDIELLFSRKPFVRDVGEQFAVVRPATTLTRQLKGKASTVKIPRDLVRRNLMVEVTGGGRVQREAYYPNAFRVDLVEQYGQLRVVGRSGDKPLTKVYVKVFARNGQGQEVFYKDGYTDLRGKFDYASLNSDDIDGVTRFAILVLSDEHGATVLEAAAPKM